MPARIPPMRAMARRGVVNAGKQVAVRLRDSVEAGSRAGGLHFFGVSLGVRRVELSGQWGAARVSLSRAGQWSLARWAEKCRVG